MYNRKDEINEGGFLMRNWTTIKEYDEILFEQAGKVAKLLSTARMFTTHSHQNSHGND